MLANRLGIDFSQDYFDLFLSGPAGEPLGPVKRFDHDQLGSQAALAFVCRVCQAHPAEGLLIGGEATGLLWWHLFQQWASDPALAEFQPTFYLLNPAPVKHFRYATTLQDKTDPKDARLINRYLGVPGMDLHPWHSDLEYWPLRFLTRFRCRLAHTLGSFKSYAHTWIYLQASAYESIHPFSNTFGKTSLEILRQYPTLDSLAAIPLEELAEQLDVLGKRRFPDPLDNARKLQDVAQHSYPLDPQVVPVVHFILCQTLDVLRLLEQRLKVLDTFIAQQVQDDADVANLDSIGGIGPVYAAGLSAEICPTQRFLEGTKFDAHKGCHRPRTLDDAQAAVAKLAGLWWPRHDSGQFKAQDRRLPRACNPYLRYYLVEAANHVRGCVAEYGAFYQRKYDQATKHHHHRALILTARKLARLVFVLLHKHQSYQPGGQRSAPEPSGHASE